LGHYTGVETIMPLEIQDELDRAIGALIGSAIGDALGAPLEFENPRSPDRWVTAMTGGGSLGWRKGEVTDDTIMAKAICEMYISEKSYFESSIISKWIQWANTNPKDIGNWTKAALQAWKNELPQPVGNPALKLWEARGKKDAGNGGVMRCIPTAIAVWDEKLRIKDTVRLCTLTHPDPRCTSSCVMVVETAFHLIQGEGVEEAVEKAWMKLPSGFTSSDKASSLVRQAVESAKGLPWEEWSNGPYTIDTVQSAFAAFWSATSFEEGLVKVINRGNDADTVGAVAGGLLGARFGVQNIPRSWLRDLEEGYPYLRMARTLFQNRTSRLSLDPNT
jgi:ADP-ribosyl-[dinitrogen reductase] hydrolase